MSSDQQDGVGREPDAEKKPTDESIDEPQVEETPTEDSAPEETPQEASDDNEPDLMNKEDAGNAAPVFDQNQDEDPEEEEKEEVIELTPREKAELEKRIQEMDDDERDAEIQKMLKEEELSPAEIREIKKIAENVNRSGKAPSRTQPDIDLEEEEKKQSEAARKKELDKLRAKAAGEDYKDPDELSTPTAPVLTGPQLKAEGRVRAAQIALAEMQAKEELKESKNKLVCPNCGSKEFRVEDGIVQWCASCGCTATSWAYKTPELTKQAKEYVRRLGKTVSGKAVHKDTPMCGAPTRTSAGKVTRCPSKEWVHDGEKLLRCSKCGANYTNDRNRRAQPKNVQIIIDTLGSPEVDAMNVPGVTRPVTPQGAKRVRKAQGRQVNPTTDRAYSEE